MSWENCEEIVREIESYKIEGIQKPIKVFRVNNKIALCVTNKFIYLVDVTSEFKELKIIKQFSKMNEKEVLEKLILVENLSYEFAVFSKH